MTQVPISQGGNAAMPKIPSGRELYDQIMKTIEPELVSTSVVTLKEKYKNETPAEAQARGARYTKAFKAYDKTLADYLRSLSRSIKTYARAAAVSLEKLDRSFDHADLSDLEREINQ